MALKGFDFAWTKPTPAQVKANGGHWVAGYFSHDATKDLTHALVSGFLAADIAVVSVWETTTGRATEGQAAGVTDAHAAEAQRIACGLPATHVIYFAVDEDTSWASVQAYFDGAVSVLGAARVGVYGGYHVVEGAHAHGIRYLWQTIAWSGGQWSAHANIRQEGGTVWGGSADVDQAEVTDYGQTPRPANVPAGGKPPVKPPLPTVSLAHVVAAAHKDPAAPQGHLTFKADVLIVEHALAAEGLLDPHWVDGSYGSKTVAAYAAWQRHQGFSGSDADGIPGHTTLAALGARHGFHEAA
jgi:hypothetical protein